MALATDITEGVVSSSESIRLRYTSMIDPAGQIKENKLLVPLCQKEAKEFLGGRERKWAGVVTDTLVSDLS
jgi:hypothetical protein